MWAADRMRCKRWWALRGNDLHSTVKWSQYHEGKPHAEEKSDPAPAFWRRPPCGLIRLFSAVFRGSSFERAARLAQASAFSRGMHLIVDGYDCRSELLSDRRALLRWLNGLPAQIGMSVLLPAAVARIECPRCKPGDEGLSGFVIICESHIAVHTWPARGEIQADVYSCRPFDPEPLLARIVADFGIGSCDTKLIERRRGEWAMRN